MDSILFEFYAFMSNGPEYYGAREYFDNNGDWIGSAPFGYDFKCDDHCGYVRYWSNVSGDTEYLYTVSLDRYYDLFYSFMTEDEGEFETMKAYEEWEYKDLIDAIYKRVP